jgi:hypothetical protein
MIFIGEPNEVADRILHLHELLGHCRQILQMDVGGMPHAKFLKSIELLGSKVLPQIQKKLELLDGRALITITSLAGASFKIGKESLLPTATELLKL